MYKSLVELTKIAARTPKINKSAPRSIDIWKPSTMGMYSFRRLSTFPTSSSKNAEKLAEIAKPKLRQQESKPKSSSLVSTGSPKKPSEEPGKGYPSDLEDVRRRHTDHDVLREHHRSGKPGTEHSPTSKAKQIGHLYSTHVTKTVSDKKEIEVFAEMARTGQLMGVLANAFPGGSTVVTDEEDPSRAFVALGKGGSTVTMRKPNVTEKDGVILVSTIAATTPKHLFSGEVCWSIMVDTKTNTVTMRFDGAGKQESFPTGNVSLDKANMWTVNTLWNTLAAGVYAAIASKAADERDPHSYETYKKNMTPSDVVLSTMLQWMGRGSGPLVWWRHSGVKLGAKTKQPLESDFWNVEKPD